MRRFFSGFGALAVIGTVLLGVPFALIALVGNPIPTADQWQSIVSLTPDYGNQIMLTKLLPCLAWLAWAAFAGPLLVEMIASAAGRTTSKRSWAFGGQQRIAATLIAAVLAMGAGSLSFAPTPAVAQTPAQPAAAGATYDYEASLASSQQQSTPPEAAQQTTTETVHETVEHTVTTGDTLWGIAETHLGDGQRYGEIVEASEHIVQSDQRTLTDPDLILPGWTVDIPGVAVEKTVAAATDNPSTDEEPAAADSDPLAASDAAAGGSSGSAATGNQTDAANQWASDPAQNSSAAEPTETDDAAGNEDESATEAEDFSVPLMTSGGVAGLLAAGLLSTLAVRRLRQRRRRASGTRIAMPSDDAVNEELELRMVETPLEVADLDNALRHLQLWAEDTDAPLPRIYAARLAGSEIALYLTEPAQLPSPFESAHPDGTAWIVRPGTAAAPDRASIAPYPALVTLGVDAQGGLLLFDLEHFRSLNLVGDPVVARRMLNSIALELSQMPWADQIQITLVGMELRLAQELSPYRVQHVEDVEALLRNLRSDIKTRSAGLQSHGVDDVHHARAAASEDESWAPHIVLLGAVPEPRLQEELAELVGQLPRLGLATVSNGANPVSYGATVDIESEREAKLFTDADTPPLPFIPQILTDEELLRIEELFNVTELEAHPATANEYLPATGADEPFDELVANYGQDEAPVVAEVPEHQGAGVDDLAAQDAAAPDWPAPYVRLLGPVDALQIANNDIMPGRGIELMAYLSINGTAEGKQLQSAFWPDTPNASNNQRQLAKKVRVALGHAPDGTNILPENVNHQGYTLHPAVRSDWDEFRALIGPDLSRTSNERLIAAIRLVRGTPFAGANTKRWWQWISIAQEEMIAAVMDAATELSNRALGARQTDQALLAASVAKAVDPLNEAGWRVQVRVALEKGDGVEFRRIVEELYARVGGGDPDYEVDLETQELIDEGTAQLTR